ncbi:hypothetical protein [Billgrantia sp. C5P2]|uniref:hypothetical protein n=1 Tax=Billgrantia sp. C5P2 TaxID=3436239 RepID=UPI003DA242D2
MATPDWQAIDIYDHEATEHYCAFLDILGYKKKSEEYFSGSYNLYGRFRRALSHAIEVQKISSLLWDVSGLDVKFFSDSVILTIPKDKSTDGGLIGLLHFCRVLSAHLSFEGLFLRGGISEGLHKDVVDNEYGFSFTSSVALQRAYVLDSTKAIFPRIVIDSSIIESLIGGGEDYVIKDGREFVLHFAPQLINRDGGNEDIILAEMQEIYEKKMRETDAGVIAKHEWVLDYYYWTLTQSGCKRIDRFEKFITRDIRRFRRFSLLNVN